MRAAYNGESMKKSRYVCSNCGYTTYKWIGKCPSCGEWNTFEEQADENIKSNNMRIQPREPVRLDSVKEENEFFHINKQIDNFFGKGLIKGGVYLIAGSPGIGKSTFLLQMAKMLDKNGHKVLYTTAEESIHQLSVRAKRLSAENINAIYENDVDSIAVTMKEYRPDLIIIDSIHAIYSKDIESVAGGIQQVRHCSEIITETAKKYDIAAIMVAHITKGGNIAGPKTLEHMVDTVLHLEGDNKTDLRILKSYKNRFGSTGESLIMEMNDKGLNVVDNIALKFLDEKQNSDGVVYSLIKEGSYPMLIEVQSLCVTSALTIPRRISIGFDINRLNMLIAIIEKKLNIPLYKYDIYLNIAGGVKISSTSIDAAVVASIISSLKKVVVPNNVVILGEMDLSGRVRKYMGSSKMFDQIESLGFNIVSLKNSIKSIFDIYNFILSFK